MKTLMICLLAIFIFSGCTTAQKESRRPANLSYKQCMDQFGDESCEKVPSTEKQCLALLAERYSPKSQDEEEEYWIGKSEKYKLPTDGDTMGGGWVRACLVKCDNAGHIKILRAPEPSELSDGCPGD